MVDLKDLTEAYSLALCNLGHIYTNIVVLDADIADSCKTESFRAAFPYRSFDLGIAEQSLPTFAAGLALCGKIPICNTFAVFAVHRGLDMIRQSVAYNRANVKIVGHAAGQSMGYTGPSHHTIEDFSVLRAIPNFIIFSPCDAVEVEKMVKAMVEIDGPVYLRLVRASVPDLHSQDYNFRIGIAECLQEGNDISLFATGECVHLAIEASKHLRKKGIYAQVINVPTIKPLIPEQIIQYGEKTHGAVTIEDHNIYGGLGSIISEIYSEYLYKPVKRIGIPDTFTESDTSEALKTAYGIHIQNIIKKANEVIHKKD